MAGPTPGPYDRLARLIAKGGPFELANEPWGSSEVAVFRRPPSTLRDIFLKCHLFGDKEFVVAADARITYRTLLQQAAVARHAFERQDLGRGERVALILADPFEWLRSFLGVVAAGAVPVLMDPAWGLAELQRAAGAVDCQAVISDRSWSGAVSARRIELPHAAAGVRDASCDFVVVEPDEAALVLFTSGSTGKRKAMAFDHKAVLTGLRTMMLGAAMFPQPRSEVSAPRMVPPAPGLGTLVSAPLSHVGGCAQMLLAAMLAGRVVLSEWGPNAPQLIAKERVRSVGGLTPAMLDDLITAMDQALDLGSLRTINVQGGSLAGPRLAELQSRAPQLTIAYGYGLTESFGAVAFGARPPFSQDHSAALTVAPTVQVRIVGSGRRPVPRGDAGRIELRGRMLAKTCGSDEPGLRPGEWFDTGDLGRFDPDGRLLVLDREQNCVVSGEALVSASELEAAALNAPEVLHAVASLDTAGRGFELRLAARPGRPISIEAMKARLMVEYPDARISLKIVPADDLQRSQSGKFVRTS